MAQYQVRYTGARAQPSNNVMVEVRVLASYDNGATWETLPGGDTSIGIPADTILEITRDGALTDAQKRGAINALLLARIVELGLTASRDALEEMEALLPTGWPVTVNL